MPISNRFADFLRVLVWGLALGVALLALGCERCSGQRPLARLEDKQGQVERDRASAENQWFPAEIGTKFEVGDAIQTRAKSGAVLALDDGSRLGLEEETLVRFLDREPGASEQRVDLQMGSAYLEAGAQETYLHTLFGLARVEAGARVHLRRSGDSLRFEVVVGSASLENTSGEKVDLQRGQAVEIALGQATLEVLSEEPSRADNAERDEPAARSISAEVRGKTVRIRKPGEGEFEPLQEGTTSVAPGSTLEVGTGSSVQLQRGNERANLGPGGTYVVGGEGGLIETTSGTFQVASDDSIQVKVPGGVIVARAGRAKIESLGREGTRVTAEEGEVSIRGKTTEVLIAGDQGLLSPAGDVQVEGRGPARWDVVINAGESVTIHDPEPPTAVRVAFDGKCKRGSLRLSGGKGLKPKPSSRGVEGASFGLESGTVAYALHCLDAAGKEESQARASGKITVLRDAGTRPVPKSAPVTGVEVDGRSYTVLYQNLLPRVSLRWSKAPADAAGGFQLHVRSGGRVRTISTKQASYTFPSGALGEGTHTVHFEGGGRVSRQTTITILFDNAATTVSLSAPDPRAAPGSTVPLSGVALPGWAVTVDGQAVPQDADGRFSASSVMPEGGQPVSIVLTHPSRGTHIYLRRSPKSR